MAHVKVYDPAVCCSTGVCSPDADASIAQFSAALDKARKAGAVVDRFTLAHQPAEYVANARVKQLLDSEGVEALPVVFVDDEMLCKGGYPSREALLARLGLSDAAPETVSEAAPGTACAPGAAVAGGCCS